MVAFRSFQKHVLFYESRGDDVLLRHAMHGQRDLPQRLIEPPEGECMARKVFRASGAEPLIRCYLEAKSTANAGTSSGYFNGGGWLAASCRCF